MKQACRFLLPAAILAMAFGTLPAAAATWSKTTTANSSNCNAVVGTSCAINNGAADGGTATVTGWANIGDNAGTSTPGNLANSGLNGYWRAANLSNQGSTGLGLDHTRTGQDAQEGGFPEHSFDNDGRTDAALFSFGTSKTLAQVTFGWSATDLDFTVLAWTGAGGPNMGNFFINNSNGTTNMTAGNGWTLVGNYANTASSSSKTVDINASNTSSSHWLILAYNSAFGTGTNLSMGNDYFKLFGVTDRPSTRVSEPGALALAGLALLGGWYSRRRRA